MGRCRRIYARSPKIWLMFGWDGHHRWSRAALTESVNLLDILLQKWIVTQIRAESGEVVSVSEANVVTMFNDHIPAHKAHL